VFIVHTAQAKKQATACLLPMVLTTDCCYVESFILLTEPDISAWFRFYQSRSMN